MSLVDKLSEVVSQALEEYTPGELGEVVSTILVEMGVLPEGHMSDTSPVAKITGVPVDPQQSALGAKKRDRGKVGVVIGRFQVPELHKGHKHLISYVLERHSTVLILLGVGGAKQPTVRNPLGYDARRSMIAGYLGEVHSDSIVEFARVYDAPDDARWTANLDTLLTDDREYVLYGGRDSFIPHYNGECACVEIPSIPDVSGSALRRAVNKAEGTPEFNRGAIYTTLKKFHTVYATVDMIVVDRDNSCILLGRKTTDLPGKWRFPGGFVDPADASYEEAALRELVEECGANLVVSDVTHLGSLQIDDWRYRRTPDCVMTTVFESDYVSGEIKAGDDLCEVRWFDVDECESVLMGAHCDVFQMYLEKGELI